MSRLKFRHQWFKNTCVTRYLYASKTTCSLLLPLSTLSHHHIIKLVMTYHAIKDHVSIFACSWVLFTLNSSHQLDWSRQGMNPDNSEQQKQYLKCDMMYTYHSISWQPVIYSSYLLYSVYNIRELKFYAGIKFTRYETLLPFYDYMFGSFRIFFKIKNKIHTYIHTCIYKGECQVISYHWV